MPLINFIIRPNHQQNRIVFQKHRGPIFLTMTSFKLVNFWLLMPGSLSQPVIFLPFLSLCLHQNKLQTAKLILVRILLWAATSQRITVLYESLQDVLGEVLPGNYCIAGVTERHPGRSPTRWELLCAVTCMCKAWLSENYRLLWCRRVYERPSLLFFKQHWVLRNVPYCFPWTSCLYFFFVRKQNSPAYGNCVLYS